MLRSPFGSPSSPRSLVITPPPRPLSRAPVTDAAVQAGPPAPSFIERDYHTNWQEKLGRGFTSEYPARTERPAPFEEISLLGKMANAAESLWQGIKAFAAHMSPRIQLGIGVNVFRFFQ